MSIYEYFHRHSRAVLFTVAIVVLAGIATLFNLPVSLFPDVTFPRIVILADNGEQPAERMIVEVTKPLEDVASAIPGVQFVRSTTSRGSTEISVGLHWGVNVAQTLQLLQGRISNIRNILPAKATVQAEQMTVSVFPIQGFSLTSDSLSQVELRDLAYFQLRPVLLRVNGIAKIEVTGGDVREFQVIVSPEKLLGYHLDIRDVANAIEKTNQVGSTGMVENSDKLYLSLVSGLLKSTEDISNVVVTVRNGVPIRVSQIGDVQPAIADKLIRTTAHGKDAVLLNILKQPGGSTVQISEDIDAALAGMKLPPSVRFERFYDQGDFILTSILGTRDSILIGVFLAMLVVYASLRHWRASLVIVLVVPATIATTFLCLYAVGLTINIMTLGGIAAAVGLIIDDAIVIIEDIFTRFSRPNNDGAPVTFPQAAARSLRDIMPAILGSTASTIVIHIPLAFLGGIVGAFFASLSITMVFAMLISFVFSISLVPLLGSLFISEEAILQHEASHARHVRFDQWYGRIMHRLLPRRMFILPVALLFIAAAYWMYGNVGTDFMPEMDEGTFVLDYWTPAGTSLTETNRMLMDIERHLMNVPEVESYSRRTGTQLGFFLTEANTGDYLIRLKKDRSRSIEEVIAEVRDTIATVEPSVRTEFGQLMMDVIGDLTNSPSPIEIKLFSDNQSLLKQKSAEVEEIISGIPGVVDAFNGIVISGPSFVVTVDPSKAAIAGTDADEVAEQLEAMMEGKAGSSIAKGEKLIPVRVRFPLTYRTDFDKLQRVSIMNRAGIPVPLQNIASITRTGGQTEIAREGLRPFIAVTARISGRDLGSTVTQIKHDLAQKFVLPRGMTIEYGGVYQTQQESFRGLVYVALAALLLVFIVLLFEFGEFAVPFSIVLINLMSLVGVIGALWLSDMTFNVSSFVGLIMIIGIVAENAVFIMHNIHNNLREGMLIDDAIIRGVTSRRRPIIMTTLATVLALLPLAIGIGTGSQMQQPLAIAVLGGFSVSSFLLIFGLPILYRLFRRS